MTAKKQPIDAKPTTNAYLYESNPVYIHDIEHLKLNPYTHMFVIYIYVYRLYIYACHVCVCVRKCIKYAKQYIKAQ